MPTAPVVEYSAIQSEPTTASAPSAATAPVAIRRRSSPLAPNASHAQTITIVAIPTTRTVVAPASATPESAGHAQNRPSATQRTAAYTPQAVRNVNSVSLSTE